MRLMYRAAVALIAMVGMLSCSEESTGPEEGGDDPSGPSYIVQLIMGEPGNRLNNPVALTAPAGDDRIFVVEQPGEVIVRFPAGTQLSYLNLRDQTVVSQYSYGGLVGIAFHPDFANNGYVFALYTNSNTGHPTLSRFQAVPPTANSIDKATEQVFFEWDIEDDTMHQECDIAFDPRTGYLYVALGDGSTPQGVRREDARDLTKPAGKILRLDIDTPDGGAGTMYSIPSDNPYATTGGGVLPEIWASGLRHPWRMSFDSQSHAFLLSDVGRNINDEVNVELAGGPGGKDYGWPLLEGNSCEENNPGCDVDALVSDLGLTRPAHIMSRDLKPPAVSCTALTGGFVYRGSKIPELQGRYIFGDFCWHLVFSMAFNPADGSLSDFKDISEELELPEHNATSTQISSPAFGVDGHGELYIVDYFVGRVFAIINRDDLPPEEEEE